MICPWHNRAASKRIPFTSSLKKPKFALSKTRVDTLLPAFLTPLGMFHGCYKPRLPLVITSLASSFFVRTASPRYIASTFKSLDSLHKLPEFLLCVVLPAGVREAEVSPKNKGLPVA